MYNEIRRKITSLTLMTIMLAGGMTFAVPGMVPEAYAANANLFVSAENSQFDNYMSGPQVIEVIVIDSDINETNEAKGEPDVTVNGKILRMVQGVDGSWYGYFADRNMAILADTTTTESGKGLDFGRFCSSAVDDNNIVPGQSFSDTVGIAVPTADVNIGLNGIQIPSNGTIPASATCADFAGNGDKTAQNVVRESKDVSGGANMNGQIGLEEKTDFPFIQLYTLNPTGNVNVQYNKGGGAQSTILTFDTVEHYANLSLDRTIFPQGAEVHVTITDLWLNIDPTDEDSWTFGTNADIPNGVSTNYQVFDENGATPGDTAGNTNSTLTESLRNLMCNDNCVLEFNPDVQNKGAVATLQDNDDSAIKVLPIGSDTNNATNFVTAAGYLDNAYPITITEQGPKTGVFGTFDEYDTSNIVITDDAKRGTSASITYNEDSTTILVGHSFGKVEIKPGDDEWNSGEEIPFILTDNDANRNSRVDEDLHLDNPNVDLIPSLSTGNPFTLGEAGTGSDTKTTAVYISGLTAAAAPRVGMLTENGMVTFAANATITVQKFSERAIITATDIASNANGIVFDFKTTASDLQDIVKEKASGTADGFRGFSFLNLDVRGNPADVGVNVYLLNSSDDIIRENGTLNPNTDYYSIAYNVNEKSLTQLTDQTHSYIQNFTGSDQIGIAIVSAHPETERVASVAAMTVDFFSFGFVDDGLESGDRIANQIIRIEAEESGDNTGVFVGTLEYIMINQLNILDENTYKDLVTIDDAPSFIVIEDLTDEDSPRVNYLDLGSDGGSTQVADQQEAPSHSGIVSFDSDTYKTADTVTITLEDLDLNVDSDLVDIYTTVDRTTSIPALIDTVGSDETPFEFSNGDQLGRLLDVTFDDQLWTETHSEACTDELRKSGIDVGLAATGFTMIETNKESGIFVGSFQIPSKWCPDDALDIPKTATGLDIEVNYVDFRDASGEIIEVGDSAGVRANTGSVSLDRTVYPVPFGVADDFDANGHGTPTTGSTERSLFPIHQSGLSDTPSRGLDAGEFLNLGDLIIHVRVNDADFDVSASGEDRIAETIAIPEGTDRPQDYNVGPVKISVIRGSDTLVLGFAGGDEVRDGLITFGDDGNSTTRQFGPMTEIAPDAGIFEADIPIRYTDGPASTLCPDTGVSHFESLNGRGDAEGRGNELTRFDTPSNPPNARGNNYCILQGDILQVEYTDPADASGDPNTVTDSATFDLRNGVIQADKSVYIIGQDMILTLIEPDFDLDNDQAETYDLDLIEWDSDAATLSMGDKGGSESNEGAAFDPEPLNFRETGDSTGIFQVVIEIPEALDNDPLERGEEIVLEYTDWGPSGSDYVGDEDEDVNLTVFTSNFGATIELDQKVYTWTDKVYITIVAPDHNFDGDLVDEIGNSDRDPIKVATRGADIDNYKLVETGTDTGIFTGEVILTGFQHDADGDSTTGTDGNDVSNRSAQGEGPTDGLLPTDDDDGLTVSFEFSEDETVVGSALVRWNIGEAQWLEASYPAVGTGVVRIIDPDMNLNPEAVDNFAVDVFSDTDAGGIDLTVTETNEATGLFEGTVFFTITDDSSGHRLRVAEGDTVTADYEDNTLPAPYTTADELDITATSLIGTVVPPLSRAPATNLRIVDASDNSLDTVSVDQQVQISADLVSGQDKEQLFAYLVQVQDSNGVTVHLAWLKGTLSAGQSFSPASSWTPEQSGSYKATAFVWESVANPTALSPPISTEFTVQ